MADMQRLAAHWHELKEFAEVSVFELSMFLLVLACTPPGVAMCWFVFRLPFPQIGFFCPPGLFGGWPIVGHVWTVYSFALPFLPFLFDGPFGFTETICRTSRIRLYRVRVIVGARALLPPPPKKILERIAESARFSEKA